MMSSAYHPQTDGQTERLNQCLEAFLRCTVHACPTKWFRWLALAEFWYNTSFHSALGRAPFEVLYGHPPRHFGISASSACQVLKERGMSRPCLVPLGQAQQVKSNTSPRPRCDSQEERSHRLLRVHGSGVARSNQIELLFPCFHSGASSPCINRTLVSN